MPKPDPSDRKMPAGARSFEYKVGNFGAVAHEWMDGDRDPSSTVSFFI